MFNPRSIHIGSKIAERIKANGMTKAEFGRRINTSRQNVNTLLRKDTLDASLLYQISSVLKFNFFSYYDEKLPDKLGSGHKGATSQVNLNKSYSLTINSDSPRTIEDILKKLRQWDWEEEGDEDKGEDSSLSIPA